MPAIRCTHVEVYVFRRRWARIEFLALRRSAGRKNLPGVWQPVTGKLGRGEAAFDAARREVREETGLVPIRWWSLESVTAYFDVASDAFLLLPLFAAEVKERDAVELSVEHDAYEFLVAREAGRRYLWEAQRRALESLRREVLAVPALARALEIKASRASGRARGGKRRASRAPK